MVKMCAARAVFQTVWYLQQRRRDGVSLSKSYRMQKRHQDRNTYFNELAVTSEACFLPYIRQWHVVENGTDVLEVGCGEGGNLLPFARMGCHVTGVDLSVRRIEEARSFFGQAGAKGEFIAGDILEVSGLEHRFDVILCHDVLEHVADKNRLLLRLAGFLKTDGILFMAFPAWQMPFGGHQQISRNRILAHLPFIHLLPLPLYERVLRLFGEDAKTIRELLSIRHCRVTIEQFESLLQPVGLTVVDRQLWLINPHYEVKFRLTPRRLHALLSAIPRVRNFFSSSCFYLLK